MTLIESILERIQGAIMAKVKKEEIQDMSAFDRTSGPVMELEVLVP